MYYVSSSPDSQFMMRTVQCHGGCVQGGGVSVVGGVLGGGAAGLPPPPIPLPALHRPRRPGHHQHRRQLEVTIVNLYLVKFTCWKISLKGWGVAKVLTPFLEKSVFLGGSVDFHIWKLYFLAGGISTGWKCLFPDLKYEYRCAWSSLRDFINKLYVRFPRQNFFQCLGEILIC